MKFFLAVVVAVLGVASAGFKCETIGLKSMYKKYISVQPSNNKVVGASEYKSWEQIKVTTQKDGKVSLKSHAGKFLAAIPNKRSAWNRVKARQFAWFTVERVGKNVAFKSAKGKYLSAKRDGSLVFSDTKGDSEQFQVYPDGCYKF